MEIFENNGEKLNHAFFHSPEWVSFERAVKETIAYFKESDLRHLGYAMSSTVSEYILDAVLEKRYG